MHTLCSCSSSLLSHVKARRLAFYMRSLHVCTCRPRYMISHRYGTARSPHYSFPSFSRSRFSPAIRRPINKTCSLRNASTLPRHPCRTTAPHRTACFQLLFIATATRENGLYSRNYAAHWRLTVVACRSCRSVISHVFRAYLPCDNLRKTFISIERRFIFIIGAAIANRRGPFHQVTVKKCEKGKKRERSAESLPARAARGRESIFAYVEETIISDFYFRPPRTKGMREPAR